MLRFHVGKHLWQRYENLGMSLSIRQTEFSSLLAEQIHICVRVPPDFLVMTAPTDLTHSLVEGFFVELGPSSVYIESVLR